MNWKYPWQERQDARKEERKPKRVIKFTNLKRASKKQSRGERIYAVLRKDFLADNPVCQCGQAGCTGIATEVHHKKGRGKWLNVVEFFLAVCHKCHVWIERNPAKAKELGLSINRIG